MLTSKEPTKSDNVEIDVEPRIFAKLRDVGTNGVSYLTEDIKEGEVIGIITLKDVFEELLQEDIVDVTHEYVDLHKRIRVAAIATASYVARTRLFQRLSSIAVGTKGESLGLDKIEVANNSLWTHGNDLPTNQSLIWKRSSITEPWEHGESIGRYWSTYLSPSTGCTENCDFRGTYNAQKFQKKCGQPAQILYHIPWTWVHPGENLLVLREELGGNPSEIYVLTRTWQKCVAMSRKMI
ncbi:unnamed protein product [Lactuca saligna]|uniref:CBS domain-containing protein n=1 Tax=Lactuca saligna TaxID=75948 RepID=A0AA35YA90_LACSI|nr:unnamed protein product [Lactuca saligna]